MQHETTMVSLRKKQQDMVAELSENLDQVQRNKTKWVGQRRGTRRV